MRGRSAEAESERGMTWELTVFSVACLGAFVASLWLLLPYIRRRSNEETRLHALEAADVELKDRMARVEQAFEGPVLPRGLPRVGRSA